MDLKLPFDRLVCPSCADDLKTAGPHHIKPDYMFKEVVIADGKPSRTVAIDVKRMKFVDRGDDTKLGHVIARVPCINGEHDHEIDISDVYQAPELHLIGQARCSKGHKMVLERIESWEFIDDGDYGGVIELSGLFHCVECGGTPAPEVRHVKAATLPTGAEEMTFDLDDSESR